MAPGILFVTGIISALLLVAALSTMGFLSYKNHFPVDGRTVLITGGSQGMGRALGKQLAQKGANVVIVARDKVKLENALLYISSAASKPGQQRFTSISADVSNSDENIRVLDEVTAWNHGQPPDIVWANAGSATLGLFADTSIETLRAQMDINYWSAAYLAHAVLAHWLKPALPDNNASSKLPRHLIMTSSTIAFVGLAGYANYAPAKSAMRSLADSLRSEMNLYNGARKRDVSTSPATDIKVHIVLPGTILSPGYEKEGETKHPVTKILEEGDPKQTEDVVATASLRALESGHFLITTQLLGAAMRASALGGSPRDNWLVDTVFSWITSIAWLFIGPDMDRKVFNYGKAHGI